MKIILAHFVIWDIRRRLWNIHDKMLRLGFYNRPNIQEEINYAKDHILVAIHKSKKI